MDGGGTKTKCVLADENLKIIYECQGAASNFLMQGTEAVSHTILYLISECINSSQLSLSDLSSIVIGTTGAGRRSDAEKLENDFIQYSNSQGYSFKKIRVESDARIALEGAFSGKPGSILIAGTGSIMFGKNADGNIHRVGGFGRFIGDEGSGFILGKRGLSAVAKQFDGRGEPTILTGFINSEFNISDPSELITEIYRNNFDIASVAPLVIKAASMNDKICCEIIDKETEELLDHVNAMKKQITEPILKLSFIGSLLNTDNFYAKLFKQKLNNRLSGVELVLPELPPALGAVLMGKNL